MEERPSYKWLLLALLWVAFFLQQGTRQIYNATLPCLLEDFHVTKTQIGVVGSVFTLVYGLFTPFSGWFTDYLSRKWVVVGGVLLFSLGIFCSSFVSGVGLLVVTYGVMTACGQASYYPAACSLLGQVHAKTRATALSIHQTALYAGIVLCSLAAGLLAGASNGGWRTAFLVFGVLGIVGAIAIAFSLRDTPQPVMRTVAVKRALLTSEGVAILPALFLAAAFGMHVYVDCGFKTWGPLYLTDLGLPLRSAAFHSVFWHYLGAFLGVLVGSRLADHLAPRIPAIRFAVGVAGMLLAAPFLWMIGHAPTGFLVLAAMFGFGLFRGVYDSNCFAALFDVVSPARRARATGLMLCCGFVFGSSAPAVLGLIADRAGSTAPALASLAFFYGFGGFLVLVALLSFRHYVKREVAHA